MKLLPPPSYVSRVCLWKSGNRGVSLAKCGGQGSPGRPSHPPPFPSSAETPELAEERLETTELALAAMAFDDSAKNYGRKSLTM